MPGMANDAMSCLSEREAFRAMTLFLTEYYDRAGDGLVTLLADITIESDGDPLDPAAGMTGSGVSARSRPGQATSRSFFVSREPGVCRTAPARPKHKHWSGPGRSASRVPWSANQALPRVA